MSFAPELNAARTARAAARDVRVAGYALSHWDPAWPSRWQGIAVLRIADPGAPWAQLAAEAGVSKDTAAAWFRRLRHAACATRLPPWCASCTDVTITTTGPACCKHDP